MKLRIKYEKTGVLRFIGHLDIMRLFQKAIRRAKLDISYSQGFSPHQLISFAAPMPLGMTSEGEYFDAEFNSVTTSADMVNKLNQTLPDGVRVIDIVRLDDKAKNSMSIVSASDYYIYLNEECENDFMGALREKCGAFMQQNEIMVLKKSKSKEELTDIRPMIYKLEEYRDGIYMLLESGSKANLKPELVIDAMCSLCNVEYNRYDYMFHRLETYFGDKGELKSLLAAGERF